jgi:hypothetical protein
MTIKKGSVVQIKDGKNTIGFVESGRDKFKVVFHDDVDDDFKVYSNTTVAHLKVVDESLMSDKLKERYLQSFGKSGFSLKKDDFVKFKDEKGVEQVGYVAKGGANPTVIFDDGKYQMKGPARMFTVTEVVLEKDEPSAMDDWSLVGYKEFKSLSEETVAYTTGIAYKGNKVLCAENTGKGECDRVGCLTYTPENKALEKQFYEDLKNWASQFSKESHFEIDSLWIQWCANERKRGITAKKFFEIFDEEMSELTNRTKIN